jgi:5-methylcytosine-specific restriction endonuclease McrA
MAKVHKYNKSTGRKYGPGSYDYKYGKKTSKQRSQRNKARRAVRASLTAKYGARKAAAMLKGKDVDHAKPIAKGGKNRLSNLRIMSKKKNRGRGK